MKRLYKSRKDRVIAGVCGGVGEYFNLDPVLIRIIWVLFAVLGGSGVLAYIIGMVIIPDRPEFAEGLNEENRKTDTSDRPTSQTVWGVILIAIGLLVLFQQFHIFRYFSSQFWHVSWSVIFPVFIILIGILILLRRRDTNQYDTKVRGEEAPEEGFAAGAGYSTIVRPKDDRKLVGVCSGLAYYFKIDPTIIRLLWVIGTFATGGVAVLIYIILAIVLPEGEIADFEPPEGEPGTEDV